MREDARRRDKGATDIDTLAPKPGQPISWARRFFLADAGGKAHRVDIQGLRAIAVLLVLIFHAGLPLPGGLVGVDVFFVISGFIITGALVKELETTGTISIRGFYAKRAKRLLPASVLVFAATALGTLIVIPKLLWSSVAADIYASAGFVMNWRMIATEVDYNAQDQALSPLRHFWSLAIEEQFYLVWPALLLVVTFVLRRRRQGRKMQRGDLSTPLMVGMALIVGPSLWWSITMTAASPEAAYFNTFTRLWELGVGGGLAISAHWLLRTPRWLALPMTWVAAGGVITSGFVITEATPFPGYAALLPVLSTAVLIAMAPSAGFGGANTLLSLKPLKLIGDWSYSLYLWHWPLLVLVGAKLGSLSPTEGTLVVAASFVPAVLSYRYVEVPVREAKSLDVRSFGFEGGLKLGMVGLAASFALGLAVHAASWPPAPPVSDRPVAVALDGEVETEDPAAPLGAAVLGDDPRNSPAGEPADTSLAIYPAPESALKDNFGDRCVSRDEGDEIEPCPLGDVAGNRQLVLVGDSHAAQWARPVDSIAQERGWQMSLYSKQNCTFTAGLTFEYDGRPYDACLSWGDNVAAALLADPPDVALFSNVEPRGGGRNFNGYSDAEIITGFQQRWQPLIDAGTQVVVIADTPRPGEEGDLDVHVCASEKPDQLTQCAFSRTIGLTNDGTMDAAAKSTPGVTYIDLSDAICPADDCAAVIGNVLVYRDTNHLTATYAGTLAPRLSPLIPGAAG